MEGGFKEYFHKINEHDAFDPRRAFVSETDPEHKATNDKVLKQKSQAKRKTKWVLNIKNNIYKINFKRQRPKPYGDRTQRRPGLRDLNLSTTTADTSTPIRRSKRHTWHDPMTQEKIF